MDIRKDKVALPPEREESLEENWLFVLPIAMFVLLGALAALIALG